jgi:hypothetical protein
MNTERQSVLPGLDAIRFLARECPTPVNQAIASLKRIELPPPIRRLKIEATGDFWKGLTKPKIRLMGRWLERAGFRPGHRVHVTCVAAGVIELRSPVALDASNGEVATLLTR